MTNNTEPLACEDPGFPPIEVRNVSLHGLFEADLIAWAKKIGSEAANKEEAVNAILRHEYGEDRYAQLAARMAKAKEAFEASRQLALQDPKTRRVLQGILGGSHLDKDAQLQRNLEDIGVRSKKADQP